MNYQTRTDGPVSEVLPAPELERYERLRQERAGFGIQIPGRDPLEVHAGDREATGIMSDVLARDETELAATQLRDRNLASEDHLASLYARWEGEMRPAITSRYEQELRASLPPEFQGVRLTGTATWLWRSLRAAEAAGLRSEQVIQDAVQSRSLARIRDIAAVIDSRIRDQAASLVPVPARPWAQQVPQNAAHPGYAAELAEAMDRTRSRIAPPRPTRHQNGPQLDTGRGPFPRFRRDALSHDGIDSETECQWLSLL